MLTSQCCVKACMWVWVSNISRLDPSFIQDQDGGACFWLNGPTPTAWPLGPCVYYLLTLWTEWETDLLWTYFEEEGSSPCFLLTEVYVQNQNAAGLFSASQLKIFCLFIAFSTDIFFLFLGQKQSLYWVCLVNLHRPPTQLRVVWTVLQWTIKMYALLFMSKERR